MGRKEAKNYEKQRALRMAENKARMEALGLSKMADTLKGSRRNMTQKRVVVNETSDVDYEPESDDDTCNDSSGSSDYDYMCEKEIESIDSRNDEVRDKDERTDCREDEVPHEDQPSTSQPKKRKTVGRGPSKPVQSSKPMFLEFDEYELPTGEFEEKYGKQIGQSAYRIDINIRKWNKVDQVQKDALWAKTKKLFHIEEPTGKRKKNFERAVGARFCHHKSDLLRRFIDKSKASAKGNPNADKEPWELYEGYITKEQWEKFEQYTRSPEFKDYIGRSAPYQRRVG